MKIIKSQKELQEICDYWKEKLCLQHWEIRVELATPKEMEENGRKSALGLNTLKINTLRSFIQILPEKFHDDYDWLPVDMEQGVVHELLHLTFAPFCNEERDSSNQMQSFEEQMIQTLSRAYVKLRRDASKEKK